MKEFVISPQKIQHNGIECNVLKFYVQAFYHGDYIAGDVARRNTSGTVENIVCTLKNQFNDKASADLQLAVRAWIRIILEDLRTIHQKKQKKLVVCVVPRAKAQNTYKPMQMLFRQTVKETLSAYRHCFQVDHFIDGTQYIIRIKDTKTTHLARTVYGGDGPMPYPGITKDTCEISSEVKGKDILLIDDLYTPRVYIDEDAIQALYDEGANSVVFYSLGKTMRNKN